jgi:hypothetical protein
LRRAGVLAALVAALISLGGQLPSARGDGDPASDVLLGEGVFYPYSPPVTRATARALNAATARAAAAHFPLKVALIAAPVDLGVIPDLFGKPEKYAKFLDQEISYQTRQPLLVVMRDGYGTQGLPAPAAALVRTLPKPASGHSEDLARAALAAVPRIARAAGHPLVARSAGGGGSGSRRGLLLGVLVGAAAAVSGLLLVLRHRAGRGS